MKRIVLTGGGTAGHVTPNIALLPKLHELGWKHKVDLDEGIKLAYQWFCENVEQARL